MNWFDEALFTEWSDQGYAQRFHVSRVLHRVKSGQQDLIVFETPFFGRVLAIDGVIQTTERDEFIYHEMLVHVPLFAHGAAKRVLIIGGGDGGALRETLRHQTIELARLVEIDRHVIDISLQFLPGLSTGAFDDPRTEVVIADGREYVKGDAGRFDIIIIDATDPIGAGQVLFTEEFYRDCHARLADGGILAAQCGVPFMQPDELSNCHARLSRSFADVSFYLAAIPTYVGGAMAFGWASDDSRLRSVAEDVLARRFDSAAIETGYYSPAAHRTAFTLPPYVQSLLD